jgi:hypothetical protein
MTTTTGSEYFASRAAAETLLSQAATDPRACAAHREMAVRYVELAAEFLEKETSSDRGSASVVPSSAEGSSVQ